MSDNSEQRQKPHNWHAFDPKLKKGMWGHYIAQTAIATACVAVLLLLLLKLGHLVIVAALGSSAFVVFAMPHKIRSNPRYIVGGHVLCLLTGSLIRLIMHGWVFQAIKIDPDIESILACSLAVGASLFVMVATDTEHPPAAGTAVGSSIAPFSYEMAFSVVLGATLLSLGKFALRRWLKDLV
ncbi:MAG: HPP family protein [Candidatus Coatesbacteria bacterium]|nr:HPP family protein [Candidatus Coatesbacteria bacterium]